ncbi:MAG TPA: hypothetical protein EYP91_15480 [Gammaproteobacteria bacterium]|nr:hypothetical protein [Gammaproteobacteria bacterium]
MDGPQYSQAGLSAYLDPYLRVHGFHGTIAVQARQVDRETDFLLQLQSENSFIKGIVGWTDLEADELAIDQYLTYLDQVLEQFTPQRLMFGSDWPVCTLTATFDEVCDIMNLYIGKLSAHEQYLIMGESAALFYNIERV